jgi:hypothetical protein
VISYQQINNIRADYYPAEGYERPGEAERGILLGKEWLRQGCLWPLRPAIYFATTVGRLVLTRWGIALRQKLPESRALISLSLRYHR